MIPRKTFTGAGRAYSPPPSPFDAERKAPKEVQLLVAQVRERGMTLFPNSAGFAM